MATSDAAGGFSQASIDNISITFLWIAIILILAKVSSLIERFGQPAVLGELLVGILLGSLPLIGLHFFESVRSNELIHFLSELGIVILLFQLGLESSVQTMMKVGIPSLLVACTGVVAPFILITYLVGPWLMPGLSNTVYLFLGAAMTATSVGITIRVLKDMKKSQTTEARIIVGAAVIDDVLGLIILTVISGIAQQGEINNQAVFIIIFKALLFLVGGIFLGRWLAPYFSLFFSKITTGVGMKFTLVMFFCLTFAYIASIMGLAPIVGAFTAGLILESVYFKQFDNSQLVENIRRAIKGENISGSLMIKLERIIENYSHKHIEEFVDHIGHFLVPIFFVLTGMQVRVEAFLNPKIILISSVIFVVAVLSKVIAGYVAGKGLNRLAIGVGMVPRGEVGLIFANIGKGLGIMDDAVFSAIVMVIMLTTLITPPILTAVFKR
ncbi:MAG: cation:proton antiporter [Deltaproteobacteria bacterium]|nr:cation:proton antiporter [Deltaproteobacteria bacterium]